jgi:chromosome segregation ATPase
MSAVPLEKLGHTVHNAGMESAAISGEIERLESELDELRTRVAEDNSSFASLEDQIESLKKRLTEAQDEVRRHEESLVEKRAALAEAERLERLAAYEKDLAQYREARDRVEKSADDFLVQVEAYDGEVVRLRKLRAEMRDAFGEDERLVEVDQAVDEDANGLTMTWKAVVGAAEWRLQAAAKRTPAATPPEAATSKPAPSNGDEADDHPAPDEGRAARILEYFGKS